MYYEELGEAEIAIKRRAGWTKLMLASLAGDLDTVLQLLKDGADIHKRCEDGLTALMCATCHPQIVQALLSAGARCEDRSNDGWNALHDAAEDGCLPSVRILLSAGSRPDLNDVFSTLCFDWDEIDPRTAQEIALMAGHMEVAAVLAVAEKARRHVGPRGLQTACCEAIMAAVSSSDPAQLPTLPLPPTLLRLLEDHSHKEQFRNKLNAQLQQGCAPTYDGDGVRILCDSQRGHCTHPPP